MADHYVKFDLSAEPVSVPTGTLLSEAMRLAGIDLNQPCGGQGRCGRCTVQVTSGTVRRRSSVRLSKEAIAQGYALACQTIIEGDVSVSIPPQEKIERQLTTDRIAIEVKPPEGYDALRAQTIHRIPLTISPPSFDDQTDDWSRLQTALRQQAGVRELSISLNTLKTIGSALRTQNWEVTAYLEWLDPQDNEHTRARLVKLSSGLAPAEEPLWGAAIDIGTTTVSVWLVNLLTGEVKAQVAEYNGQIARGEDVISRIIYAGKNNGLADLQSRVVNTINGLLELACKRVRIAPQEIVKTTVAGNSTMIHLFLGIPASSIRLSPFVTAVNNLPPLTAGEVGLRTHPEAVLECLPGVASYVGADITAGVFSSGMENTEKLTLFIDVGTNGEIVLGNQEWLVTCACSAGPAFEGAGVLNGMRATKGAIEEVWIAGAKAQPPYEPSYRVIGGVKARGLCGSGLISLLAEMFLTGIVDKAGNINPALSDITARVRNGDHGTEYVVAWGEESENGKDIVITNVDIDNLKRAKAAIFAGFTILGESVSIPLEMVEQLLIGGSFGKYINVEKAIQIGLLPDMPWDQIQFLGNTSLRGAYYALLDWQALKKINEIATSMTYIELSADNSFYEAFMSAMFLPHTDLQRFPTVEAAMEKNTIGSLLT